MDKLENVEPKVKVTLTPIEKRRTNRAKVATYLKNHAECGLKVGDKVTVLREADDYEEGWGSVWVEEMDGMVGMNFKIQADRGEDGFELRQHKYDYHFPYFVLEKATKKPKKLAVEALLELYKAGSEAFLTCNSGPADRHEVVAKFKDLEKAQEFHRALIQCGEAAKALAKRGQNGH